MVAARFIVVFASVILWPAASLAQAAAPPARPAAQATTEWLSTSTVTQWNIAAGLALGAAEAMPDEKFQFRPAPGARTFVEQVNHTSGVIANLLRWVAGTPAPPGGNDTFMKLSSRTEALGALRRVIEQTDAALKAKTARDLGVMVDTEFFGRTSKQDVLANLIGHTNRQYGQFVVYLRLNGITPPASRQP